MKHSAAIAALALVTLTALRAQSPAPAGAPNQIVVLPAPPPSNNYPLTPDSQPQPGVPKGATFKFQMTDSKVFPNTTRTVTVYIPAAYKADKPACLYVGLDSLGYNVPTVFDNLIAQHAMPVTIGIGVSPGAVFSAASPDGPKDTKDPHDPSDPRYDRSFEFDSVTDRLAVFLMTEVVPEVERHQTPSGLPILISKDPNDHAIGGGSTGGIGAFNAAFQRPDAFRRVFMSIGTFVGMRGGERLQILVRKTEPRPIRIFMQDGINDHNPGGSELGNWWLSNLTMESALSFAGYEVEHVWGTGTHDGSQASQEMPRAMRFLWRDWPAAVTPKKLGNSALSKVLLPGQAWQTLLTGCASALTLAADPAGAVFAATTGPHAAEPLPTSSGAHCTLESSGRILAFGPDGRTYTGSGRSPGITVRAPNTGNSVIAASARPEALSVRSNGDIYFVQTSASGKGEIWLTRMNGDKTRVAGGLKDATGMAFSPDGAWLLVTQRTSRWAYSYRVAKDGTLDSGEPFYDLYVPQDADDPGASAAAMDREGRAYVATRLGVQVLDHNGRVIGILPMPDNEPAVGLCFGDHDFTTLYVSTPHAVFTRKLKTGGTAPAATPEPVPNWAPS